MICLLSTWLYFSGCNLQPRLRNLTGLSGRDDFRRDLTGVSGCMRVLTGVSGRDLTGLSGFSNLLFGIYRLLFWKSERIILIINA